MTVPRLFVHVGDRKTGTTTIQHVLDARSREPNSYGGTFGIYYPSSGRLTQNRINHVNLAHELLGDPRYKSEIGSWADLAKELETQKSELTVISCEGFESVEPNVLAEALKTHVPEGTDVKIISYIRPHVDRIVASYAQNVKTGRYNRPLNVFARRSMRGRLGALHKRAIAWKAVFADQYHVRPYVRDLLIDRDVVADLLVGQIGLGPEVMTNLPPIPDENPTPGTNVLELIRQLTAAATKGGVELPSGTDRKVLAPLRKTLMELYPDDPKVRLSREEVEACIASCMADAQSMDRDFFGGEPVFEGALLRARDGAADQIVSDIVSSNERAIHEAYAAALATLVRLHGEK
ncbi:hypothetical protein [Shimia sp. MIT910701]|uniref:hypothetical protein n=1 Tax=Shimia sp. MIT910701 TaxID=3096987 RepID=UPI00399BD26F